MWQTEWRALSARIEALREAATFFWLSGAEGDGVCYLTSNTEEVVRRIDEFQNSHGSLIPTAALRCLADFVDTYHRWHPKNKAGTSIRQVQFAVTALASFRAEFNYLLADSQAIGRSLVARAFQHLQRSIVADRRIRESWQDAFKEGELACEKLGACHLLLHGVWAFKAHAEGERTDLVLGTPLQITSEIRAAADTLALTEWKVVRNKGELDKKCQEALDQARCYGGSILAGFELSSRRFLVIVSEDWLPKRAPQLHGSVTYEFVNVAVSPSKPSKAGRV